MDFRPTSLTPILKNYLVKFMRTMRTQGKYHTVVIYRQSEPFKV